MNNLDISKLFSFEPIDEDAIRECRRVALERIARGLDPQPDEDIYLPEFDPEVPIEEIEEARGILRDEDEEDVSTQRLVVKADSSQRLTYGIVLEPEVEDAQGDILSAEEIERIAHDWMAHSRRTKIMHEDPVDGEIVESYIAPVDMVVEGQNGQESIPKGAWVLVVRWPESVWPRIVSGELNAYSIGGVGMRRPEP